MKKILLITFTFFVSVYLGAQGAFVGTVSANGTLQSVSWFDVTFSDADGIPDGDDDVVLTIDNSGGPINLSSIADFEALSFTFDVLDATNPFTFFAVLGRTFTINSNLDMDNSPVTTFRILSNSVLEIGGDIINTTNVLFSFTGGTVLYNGSSDQVILPETYGVLEFAGSGEKLISNTGANSISASTFTPNTSTVNFNSTSSGQVLPIIGDYYNVLLSGQSKELGANLSLLNELEISTGISLETRTYDLNIGGNLVLDGDVVNTADEAITFDGSLPSVISGSGLLNTKNLVVNKDLSSTIVTLNLPVEIESDGEVTINQGVLNSNNNLTLLSSSESASARIPELNTSNASIVGNVTAERFIPSAGTSKYWWHIGSPLSGVSVSDLQDDFNITGSFSGSNEIPGSNNNQSMRGYDETNSSSLIEDGWIDFPATLNSEQLNVGTGYRVFLRNTNSSVVSDLKADVTGTVTSGDFNFGITHTSSGGDGASDGWNFISNPYLSPIDWNLNSEWTKTNVAIDAFVWDAQSKVYRTVSSSNGFIPSFQGFWVQALSASPELIITEGAKVSSSQAFSRPASELNYNQLEISVTDNNPNNLYNTSITYLTIDDNAKEGKDPLDVSQLGRNFGNETWARPTLLDIASKSTDNYILRNNKISPHDDLIEIPLEITFNEGTDFGFEFHKQNFQYETSFILKDNYQGTEQVLDDHTYVNFNINDDLDSKSSNRFSLVVSSRPLYANNDIKTEKISVYPNPISSGELNVKGISLNNEATILISDVQGNLLSEKTILPNTLKLNDKIDVSTLNKGVYLLTVKTVDEIYTQKIIIE